MEKHRIIDTFPCRRSKSCCVAKSGRAGSEGRGGIVAIREAGRGCAAWGCLVGWRGRFAFGRGGGVERGGEGPALLIDAGQQRDGPFGAVDQAVAVRQEADRLLVRGQRRGQLGRALFQVGDDPFELVEGILEGEVGGLFGAHRGKVPSTRLLISCSVSEARSTPQER